MTILLKVLELLRDGLLEAPFDVILELFGEVHLSHGAVEGGAYRCCVVHFQIVFLLVFLNALDFIEECISWSSGLIYLFISCLDVLRLGRRMTQFVSLSGI